MKLNTALIILYDSRKRFLLQHRTPQAERLPNYWAFFGGGIDEGESPLEAVYREAFEELDYRLKNPEFIFEQNFELDDIEGHMWVYVDAFSGDKAKLKLQEGQAWGWYAALETKVLKMIDHDRKIIEKVVQYLEENKETTVK